MEVLSREHGPQDPIEVPAALGRQRQQAPQAWPVKWGWKFVAEEIQTKQKRIETVKKNGRKAENAENI